MRVRTTAIALAMLSLTAAAEPPPGPPPGGRGGAGLVGILLSDTLHASLNLSADQEAQWTALRSTSDTLRTRRQATGAALRAAIDAEFAKSTPDVLLIEETRLDAMEADVADARTLFASVESFCKSLSSTQQAAVVAALRTMRSNPPPRPPAPQ